MPVSPSPDIDWYRTLGLLDVAVVVQDRDRRIVFANEKATSLLGITTREITQRTTDDARWEVITTDGTSVAPDEHPGPEALRTGVPVRGRVLGVRVGDAAEYLWILASAIPEFDTDGSVCRVLITFSDVSDTQRAHRLSEATYQSVFRSMSEGLVIHNVDGTIRAANPAAERVLGLSVEQMTGRDALDPSWRLVRTDGSPATQEDIPSEITSRSGIASRAVLGVHRPNDELAWLEVHADPLREDADAPLTGVIATFTDITSERQATLALEASRAQIQRVLDAVPGVVYQYLHDHHGDGRVTFAAGRIRDVIGVDERAVREEPMTLFRVLDEAEAGRLNVAMAAAVAERARFEHEMSVRHPDHGRVWIRIYGVPAETPDGVLYTGVMLDATAEHQMADALLRRQRREAMGEMAGGIAHNFNNMLAVILPNVQLAREQATPEQEAHLIDAERAAVSAADLVKRMLALGRADHPDATERVDIVGVVRDAVHICRQTFDRGIRIEDELPYGTAFVRGSMSTMQQVVLNLLLNARDAMQGCANPTLSVTLADADADSMQLTVRDTGAGMSEETLQRLGEPFFTTKPPGYGTGLGLASAFQAIGEAGGNWQVQSAPGEGTTFVVQLPLVTDAPIDTPAKAMPIMSVTGTVLVVDDEPMVRSALARQLRQIGMQAVTAESAPVALQQLAIGIPNLRAIVLDLSMPVMSGVDALPVLREAAPGVPVIALSGHVTAEMQLDGAAAVLQKPLGMRELVAALARVIVE
jgi:PAS domain S-box-containing protein